MTTMQLLDNYLSDNTKITIQYLNQNETILFSLYSYTFKFSKYENKKVVGFFAKKDGLLIIVKD